MLVTWLVVFPCADLWEWAESLHAFEQYDSCDVNGHIYPHGAVIAGPTGYNNCIKQTCIDAVVEPAQEGCLDTRTSPRVCRPRGSFFTHACSTYTCDESNSVVKTRGLCQDNVGACHEPGTRFARWMRRTLYTNCTCEIEDDYLTYSCYIPS